jgi:hypothetical protein
MKGALLRQFDADEPETGVEIAIREDEDGRVLVDRAGGYNIADLTCVKSWTPSVKTFLRDHDVDGVWAYLADVKKFGGRSFFRDIRNIRSLTLSADLAVLPLNLVCELPSLERLRIGIPTLSASEKFDWKGFDFRRLTRLVTCSVTMAPESTYLLSCEWLRSLGLGWGTGKSGTLDLSQMAQLKELVLDGSRAKSIVWGPSKPLCLGLKSTRRLSINWNEMAPTVKYLYVTGDTNFDLSELAVLRNLRVLELRQLKTIPKLDFLLDMPELKAVNYRVPRTPHRGWKELSKDNMEILSEINARNGYERDFSMREYKRDHVGWE